MLVARRYVVSGSVQGVGFRIFVADHAAREGLRGWVRNLPDGGVEVSVEGDSESVERLARRLTMGPPRARVTDVRMESSEPGGHGRDFQIR